MKTWDFVSVDWLQLMVLDRDDTRYWEEYHNWLISKYWYSNEEDFENEFQDEMVNVFYFLI